jgi:RNA polymerase primary sigma factor
MKLSDKKIRIIIEALRAERGLTPRADSDDSGSDLDDSAVHQAPPLEQMVDREEFDRLLEGLRHIDDRRAKIIRMRFGLETGSRATLRQVGEELCLTLDRVRQAERCAIRDLMNHVGVTPEFANLRRRPTVSPTAP